MASESWIAILIVDGYIRSIDKLLNNQIIPNVIKTNNKYFIFILSDIPNKEGIYTVVDMEYKDNYSHLKINQISNNNMKNNKT